MLSRKRALLSIAAIVCLGWFGTADAATDGIAAQQNLPPVAAPTDKIEVNTIPVVRTASQQQGDFAAGLITGLIGAYRVPGLAIAVVREDRVSFEREFGDLTPDSQPPGGMMRGLLTAVAAMQQIERGKFAPGDDVAKALGGTARNITVAQLLDGEVNDPDLLLQLVSKSSGRPSAAYLQSEILDPLGMSQPVKSGNGGPSVTDMTHLMIALLNGGTYAGAQLLKPETVRLMESTRRTPHPGLPGSTFGFSEMHRGGWRALVHEESSDDGPPGAESRLVIVPDAKLAYYIAIDAHPDAHFWRLLDDNLFDALVASQAPPQAAAAQGNAPDAAAASRAAGLYLADADATSLKLGKGRIRVSASSERPSDLVVRTSGFTFPELQPRPGGFWSSRDGSIAMALVDGQLVLNTTALRNVAFWKRPGFYAWLALIAAFGAVAARYREWRYWREPKRLPSGAMLAMSGAAILFIIVSAFVYVLAPLPA